MGAQLQGTISSQCTRQGMLYWLMAPICKVESLSGAARLLADFLRALLHSSRRMGTITSMWATYPQPWICRSAAGPNEHDLALLPNGDVLCVMRTGAGDGRGGYLPYYKSISSDGGRSWSKAEVMPSIGCARPHLLQLGNATILSGGRKMMGHSGVYDRSFDLWMSQDLGVTWEHASGSYEHNAKAHVTGAPLWPESVNQTGWRFEFTSGYVGLVRVGEMSAMVLYDIMLPVNEEVAVDGKLAASIAEERFPSEDDSARLSDFVRHNPPFSFGMRIDVVPKAESGLSQVQFV